MTGFQCNGSTIRNLSCGHGFVQIWVQKSYNEAAKPEAVIIGSRYYLLCNMYFLQCF